MQFKNVSRDEFIGWVGLLFQWLSVPPWASPSHLQVCFSFACIGSSHVPRLLIGIPSRARSRPRKPQEAPVQEAPACTDLKEPCLYTTLTQTFKTRTLLGKAGTVPPPFLYFSVLFFSPKNKIDFFWKSQVGNFSL